MNLKQHFFLKGASLFFLFSFFVVASPALATDYRSPEIREYEVSKKGSQTDQQDSLMAFDSSAQNGGSIAVCDVNKDHVDETIIGGGQGERPVVKVFNGNGQLMSEFLAFPEDFKGGVNVACGKLKKKRPDYIVVGAGRGGAPHVRVFNMKGKSVLTSGFFAYSQSFHGGVNVAVGDVNGDGKSEIITGPGVGGGPQVRVFTGKGAYTGVDFFPFSNDDKGGVSVAAANVDGGTDDEIVMGIQSYGGTVKVYKVNNEKSILGEFKPYGDNFKGGINVANAKDVDNDGVEEVLTSPRQGGAPHVRIFEGHGAGVNSGFFAYEEDFRGGVALAAGNTDRDSRVEIVTLPQKKLGEGRTDWQQYIEVNLSTQTLTAYKNGIKEIEFLISSGIARYPTPEGVTQITAKLPVHDYEWSYGEGNPDNYDLPGVRNNLRFRTHFYIHEATWHNAFGTPRSHGCINVSPSNSQKIYDWAPVGTTVWIHR